MKVVDRPARRSRVAAGVISLDIVEDREGEYFEIVRSPLADPEVAVLDVQTADRHLLLLVRDGGEKPTRHGPTVYKLPPDRRGARA
jgi:hypothetical protein